MSELKTTEIPEEVKNVQEPEKTTDTVSNNNDASQENNNERNWKLFREQREKERKEKIALEQEAQRKSQEIEALKAAMESLLEKPKAPVTDGYQDLSEEDRIQKQIQDAVVAALSERDRKAEEHRRQQEAKELPMRLTQTYSDFNKVCTDDNLDYLEYHYPEVASAFKHMPDSFDKWAGIYKAVKRFIPNPDSKKDADRATKNLSKPQSMSIPGMAATGDTAPHKLDDKRRADNWARMQRVMKGLS